MILYLDYETRSRAVLDGRDSVGAYKYAQDPSTQITVTGAAFDNDPPTVSSVPFTLGMFKNVTKIVAHNAVFEWLITKHKLNYEIPLEKLHCTMASAAYKGLPLSLDKLAQALGIRNQKDKEGHAAMLKCCKPQKDGTFNEDPILLERISRYCAQDIEVTREIFKRLGPLPEEERKIWIMDFEINERGIPIDVQSVKTLMSVTQKRQEEEEVRFQKLTGGQVSSPRSYVTLSKWVSKETGLIVESVGKENVAALLSQNLPAHVREALEIKAELSKASVAKFKTMLLRENSGRVQGNFQYHGASTGRWAARGIQLQNLPRDSYGEKDYENVLKLMRMGDSDTLKLIYADPFFAASRCVRGSIMAPLGSAFINADFSSIEGRVLAWLAKEHKILEAYRNDVDVYRLTASQILSKPVSQITDTERQEIGKVAELACGYQGGPGAVRRFGREGSNQELYEQIVWPWRNSRVNTVNYWYRLEEAVIRAIRRPGTTFSFGNIKIRVSEGWLKIKLPSGRIMHYYKPMVKMEKVKIYEGTEDEREFEKLTIRYWGHKIVDGKTTPQWTKVYTYGGKLTENVVQAIARDFLTFAMLNLREAGYPLVLHIHDEPMAEVKMPFGAKSFMKEPFTRYMKIMERLPPWAPDFPLKADGWVGRRYRK